MKISQIAAATLVPATVAGVVLTAMPFGQAAPAAATTRAAHHAAPARPAKPADAVKAIKPAKPAKAGHARHHQVRHSHAVAQPATAAQPLTAGMSSFEQCVAWRESGNNPTASSAGLFGILPATWASLGYSGTAGQASVAQQKVAFSRLYAQYGTSPWAPYDGC